MEWIKDWIVGICVTAVLVSVVKTLTPQNSAGKCVQLVGALMLIITVISPFKKLQFHTTLYQSNIYEYDREKLVVSLENENEKIRKEFIEDAIETYIFQRAEEFDIKLSRVYIEMEEKGIRIKSVEIIADESVSESKANEFEKIIKDECEMKGDLV